MRVPIAIAICVAASFCNKCWSAESAEHFEATITKQVATNYLVVKPADYDPAEKYPLLIFLHGRGEQGSDLERVKIHGPFKKIAELNLPMLAVAPQSPLDEWWDVDMLDAFTEEIIDELNVDDDRVYLTGLSMGGSATWELALRRPQRFAAIAPICGRTAPSKAERLRHLPIWVFHGARDRTIPVKETERMVDALQSADIDVRVTIYPKAFHNSWTETYNNPKLYDWLLRQERGTDGDWPSDRRRNRRGSAGDGDWPSDRRDSR